MSLIVCPKCEGKLRISDRAESRRLKCPNCGKVFLFNVAVTAGATHSRTRDTAPPKSSSVGGSQASMKQKREEHGSDDCDNERDRSGSIGGLLALIFLTLVAAWAASILGPLISG